MKKNILKIALLIISFLIILCAKSYANVTSTDPTTNSGGEVAITLKSSENVYAYKISVANAGGLTFSGATSTAGQVNGSTVNGASASGVTTLATYKFKVPEVASNSTYSVSFNVSISTDGESYQNITNTSKVTVTAPVVTPTPEPPPAQTQTQPQAPAKVKSNDASLKSITIGNQTFTGSSLKDIVSYTAGSEINSIKITATKNNSAATISGTGTKALEAGKTNTFKITVTAEDGTKKNYTVNIIRLAEETTVPNVIENEEDLQEEKAKLGLVSLIIKNVELSPDFSTDVYEYNGTAEDLKDFEIDAKASQGDAQIIFEGTDQVKEGENDITILVVNGDEKVTYVIHVQNNKTEEVIGAVTYSDNNNMSLMQRIVFWSKNNIERIVLMILIMILGTIAIWCTYLVYKYSNKINSILDEEYVEEDVFENVESETNENIALDSKKNGKHF